MVSPVEAMARGEREYAARVHKFRDLWIAMALALLGAAASRTPRPSRANRSSAISRRC